MNDATNTRTENATIDAKHAVARAALDESSVRHQIAKLPIEISSMAEDYSEPLEDALKLPATFIPLRLLHLVRALNHACAVAAGANVPQISRFENAVRSGQGCLTHERTASTT